MKKIFPKQLFNLGGLILRRFGPNLAQNLVQFGPFKNLQGLALCQRYSGGAHDSQKYAQTQTRSP
jgi:hypothetical protein